jgi:hypothetical protein
MIAPEHLDRQQLISEVRRLHQWVADLQSGMYVNCVYCGHRYGPAETTPVAMADALKHHVARCPEHPMSTLVTALSAASHVLKSYRIDLADQVLELVDASIAHATGEPQSALSESELARRIALLNRAIAGFADRPGGAS